MLTPKENFLNRLKGEKCEWIPVHGWANADNSMLLPRMNKEFVARHLIFDAEPPYQYESNIYKSDWFDIEWEFVPAVGGATVHPGEPKVPDITHWEDYVSVPKIEDFDFEGCYAINKDFFKPGVAKETMILTGFWERLMSLMDVEEAAIAMIDEEQQEGVHRLFDKLADFYIDYFTTFKKYFGLDIVQIHDDWGHQRSTFFSPDTAREMILPYMKRVTDAMHSQGVFFELHCCGKSASMVPVMIDAGVDLWTPQSMNDVYAMAKQYKGSGLVFGMLAFDPEPKEDASDDEIKAAAHAWVEKYKDLDIVASARPGTPVLFKEEVKAYSMEVYAR